LNAKGDVVFIVIYVTGVTLYVPVTFMGFIHKGVANCLQYMM